MDLIFSKELYAVASQESYSFAHSSNAYAITYQYLTKDYLPRNMYQKIFKQKQFIRETAHYSLQKKSLSQDNWCESSFKLNLKD